MAMSTTGDQLRQPEYADRHRLIQGTLWTLLCLVLLLFVPAGSLAWFKGWLFVVVILVMTIPTALYLKRVNPDVIAARVNRHEGTKGWDRVVVTILIPTFVSSLPLSALDDGRFHWHPVPWWVCIIGYVLLMIGFLGITWAESVNKFFEPTVRIQTDRGHRVIDTGPYAIVRHPGYLGAWFLFLGVPLSLGSVWALIPAILSCLILVVRTILEDKTLHNELAGYREYATRVRYRLVPGVW
jgi:protein-S-isoprenylcysteine O-methyltransferase Ste14